MLRVWVGRKFLGLPPRHDLGWENAIDSRVRATQGKFGLVRRALTQRNLAIRAKLAIIRGVIIPAALYGSELWCTGEYSIKPLQKVVDNALGLAFGSHTLGKIVNMEAGFLPLHLQALKQRLGRLKAWSGAKDSWPARILARGKGGLGSGKMSWVSMTVKLAKDIGWDALRERAMGHSRLSLRKVLVTLSTNKVSQNPLIMDTCVMLVTGREPSSPASTTRWERGRRVSIS